MGRLGKTVSFRWDLIIPSFATFFTYSWRENQRLIELNVFKEKKEKAREETKEKEEPYEKI